MPKSRVVRPLAPLIATSFLLFLGPTAGPAMASVSGHYEDDVTKFGNVERTQRHLVALVKSTCLEGYAERQARAMAEKQTLYHQELGAILKKCHLREVGENVAFGYPSGNAATAAWMRSAGHRLNLLNRTHRWIGVGAYQDSRGLWYVSQVLGRAV